ncbi:hypothetical protein F5B18DRAFT_653491 [Nemania serpens]|nr:hypothetical protein F5B18DRAFT_653491 [Nemania serpens]
MTNLEASTHLAAVDVSDPEMKPSCTGKAPESDHSQSRLIKSQSSPDSGYGSFSEGKTEIRVGAPIIAFPEMPITIDLQNRFEDVKLLFAQPLLDLIDKTRAPTRDVSIKLRWMGSDKTSARPYIIIQCDRRAVKYVKRYFTQAHVREQVGTDFLVHVIPGLRRLAGQDFKVFGDPAKRTLCGMSIKIEISTTKMATMATMATMGGLVAVEKAGSETAFFGLTAGHSLTLLSAHSVVDTPQLDGTFDTDSDFDTSDDEESYSGSLFESSSRPMTEIGNIEFHSFRRTCLPENHDWALIALGPERILPNLLVSDLDGKGKALICGDASVRTSGTAVSPIAQVAMGVSVITQRGIQKGKFAPTTSSLLMAPGKHFVDTYDFIPGPGFGLQPGDSGSWAVCEETREVLGHIVSVDSMGEGYIMPLLDTLGEIRAQLAADRVFLPEPHDLERLTASKTTESVTASGRGDVKATMAADDSRLLTNVQFDLGTGHWDRSPSVSPELSPCLPQALSTPSPKLPPDILDSSFYYLSDPIIEAPGPSLSSNDSGYETISHATTDPSQWSDMFSMPENFREPYLISDAPSIIPKTKYVRPKQPTVFCEECNEHPDGFRGEHELRRHRDAKHTTLVKKFICVDPSELGIPTNLQPVNPLNKCKTCKSQKKYGAYYNAAAHLRRSHFREKPRSKKSRDGGDVSSVDKRRGEKGSSDWPSMYELKNWMRELYVTQDERRSSPAWSDAEDAGDVMDTANPEHIDTPPGMNPSASDIWPIPITAPASSSAAVTDPTPTRKVTEGYYRFRCGYFLTHDCQNWVAVHGMTCGECSNKRSDYSNAGSVPGLPLAQLEKGIDGDKVSGPCKIVDCYGP